MTPRRAVFVAALATLLSLTACSQGGADTPKHEPAAASSSATPAETPAPAQPTSPGSSASGPIRSTFFGMHDGRVTLGVVPPAPVGALRFWDSGTNWRDLEPARGQFAWGGLDTAVAAAEKAHARPLLVLGQSPTFYASKPNEAGAYGAGAASMPDLGAWRRYVTAVVQRYGDRLDYQVWNEANVVGYWTGTPRQMALLTVTAGRIIHHVAPHATVVAPPFVQRLSSQRRSFQSFWVLQSKGVPLVAAVDAVALNLYPRAEDPPEAQIGLFKHASSVLERLGVRLPVWNTEINFGLMGGPQPPPISAEQQRAFLMRTYILNAGLGVPRVYWYRWDLVPIANTLLTTPDFSTPTLAGQAYSTVRTWLLGARMESCDRNDDRWTCTGRRAGTELTFTWKPHGPPARVTVGAGSTWTDADGHMSGCPHGCRPTAGQTPIMITTP